MKFEFSNIVFEIENERISIKKLGFVNNRKDYPFVDCHIAGENRIHQMGTKIASGSEFFKLKYVNHSIKDNVLTIVQRSDLVEIKTNFTKYDDTNSLRINSSIKNISNKEIVIEEFPFFMLLGFGKNGIDSTKSLSLTRFCQSHHAESQPITDTLFNLGLFRGNLNGQKSIIGKNVGSWSTKEMLPLAILEDKDANEFFAFEIESNNSWYYEFADIEQDIYFALSTCSLTNTGWFKKLQVDEEYISDYASISCGNSFNDVIGEITKYRRHIAYKSLPDKDIPIIFNEYMHFSWDNPNETRTKDIAKLIRDLGCEYYVIDCGWHDEVDSKDIYANLGTWKESKRRFPTGLKNTIDYLHSIGLKAGLWLEPEMLGINNKKMLELYNNEEGLLTRFNKPIISRNRYFVDFKNQKVREYLTETIRYMIEDLGTDYIKLDYNEDLGIGVDKYNTSLGEGLKDNANAYLKWIDEIKEKYPNCLFESCSSGGMRMDYKTLAHFSICSTSDQVYYDRYPYIAANILAAVLPEQAAVWSYPVASPLGFDEAFNPTKEWVENNISDRQVITNMVNSFVGRIHLASNLSLLDDSKLSLIKEGLDLYNNLKEIKKQALPYFPNGLCRFYDNSCTSGFILDNKIYLAVWVLNDKTVDINIKEKILNVKMLYPSKSNTKIKVKKNNINVRFNEIKSACFIEVEVER